MVVYKRKKTSRMHGSKTHGYGSMKKHRGHGHRGGTGMGGTGKRGDAIKPSIWHIPDYFGRHGFQSKSRSVVNSVTLQFLDENVDKFVKIGLATEKVGVYSIDISKIGFNKVLSKGKLTKKMNITSEHFSAKAKEKIESAGGSAVSSDTSSKEE